MSKKFITRIEWVTGKVTETGFDSEWAQTAHTGRLWDNDLMDSVKWINYDEVEETNMLNKEDLKVSLADVIEMSRLPLSKEELYHCGKNRIDEHSYQVTEGELSEVVDELFKQYYTY